MSNQQPPAANAALTAGETLTLRQQAEARWQQTTGSLPDIFEDLTIADSHSLLQELHVHQIELEMQNEELRRAKIELEDSRTGYMNLYELAPVGYFSVSDDGLLLQANLF